METLDNIDDFTRIEYEGFVARLWNDGLKSCPIYRGEPSTDNPRVAILYNCDERAVRSFIDGFKCGYNYGLMDGARSKAKRIADYLDRI